MTLLLIVMLRGPLLSRIVPQLIQNPFTLSAIDDALVVGLQFEIAY